MFFEHKRSINLFFVLSFSVLLISTIAGSIYFIKVIGTTDDIKLYMSNYANSIKNGMNFWGIVKSSVLSYGIMTCVIFISSYFQIGYVFSLLMYARKGFVDGFTVSAITASYSFRGLHLYVPYIPQALMFIPLTCFYIAVSAVFSKNRKLIDKKTKIIYIIFSIIVFAIFCICCIFEGLLTTTFAKWLSVKVT